MTARCCRRSGRSELPEGGQLPTEKADGGCSNNSAREREGGPNTATLYAVVSLGPFLRFGCSLSMASAS